MDKKVATHPWKVQISDGYCTYEYVFDSRNEDASIASVAGAVHKHLKAKSSHGRFKSLVHGKATQRSSKAS